MSSNVIQCNVVRSDGFWQIPFCGAGFGPLLSTGQASFRDKEYKFRNWQHCRRIMQTFVQFKLLLLKVSNSEITTQQNASTPLDCYDSNGRLLLKHVRFCHSLWWEWWKRASCTAICNAKRKKRKSVAKWSDRPSKLHCVCYNGSCNYLSLSTLPVLSPYVESLFGPSRKSSPWGNFSDGELNQSINQA